MDMLHALLQVHSKALTTIIYNALFNKSNNILYILPSKLAASATFIRLLAGASVLFFAAEML